MNTNNLFAAGIILLAVLASLPALYRRSLPGMIRAISLSSAALIGVIFGLMFPFPVNLLISFLLAGMFVGLAWLLQFPLRHLRRK